MTIFEVTELIEKKYNVRPDFPWMDEQTCFFRHPANEKWFAIIMFISADKLGSKDDDIKPFINLRVDDINVLSEVGVHYVDRKDNYYLILVDLSEVTEEQISVLLDMSFNLMVEK